MSPSESDNEENDKSEEDNQSDEIQESDTPDEEELPEPAAPPEPNRSIYSGRTRKPNSVLFLKLHVQTHTGEKLEGLKCIWLCDFSLVKSPSYILWINHYVSDMLSVSCCL